MKHPEHEVYNYRGNVYLCLFIHLCICSTVLIALWSVAIYVFGFTSSERRPDDPPYGLDPVVHVALRVGHEQEGFMADGRSVLLDTSTWTYRKGTRGLISFFFALFK